MKSEFDFKVLKRRIAIMFVAAIVLAFALVTGCSLKDKDKTPGATEPAGTETNEGGTVKTPGNPVVITSPNLDYTLYDFRQSYYSNQYYMYMMYGMIGPAEYFDMVVDDSSSFIYVYNAAVDAGVTLDEQETADLDERFNTQIENVISQYANDVDESVTDEAERRAAAIELLNEDLAADDLDYDSFLTLARHNLEIYTLADKYYMQLHDAVDVTEAEVLEYVDGLLESSSEMTMQTFKDSFDAYEGGSGIFPVYVPDDCFTVDHIFLEFESSLDENGGAVFDTASRRDTEAAIEEALENTADYEAFMELEVDYGEDPGMDEESYRENGYLIHADFDSQYFTGFTYAAMNLRYGSWTPTPDAETGETYELPELKYFTLQDGTKVVKVATERGVHYIIVNKIFEKGNVSYEKGDSYWLSWLDGAKDDKFAEQYDTLRAEWEEKFPITVHSDIFRAEFVPASADAETGETDPDKK